MTRTPVNTANVLKKTYGSHNIEDDYELGGMLGKGAFGTVRTAVSRLTGETLACKSIPKSKLVYPSDVEDVQREVAIMNHVSGHAHVVTYRASYEDREAVHIVMERCDGGALFDSIVESSCYSERKAAAVFRKMVEMLHHCHELGVMHRDLKPENFLLTTCDSDISDIKAIDFGISTFCSPGQRFTDRVGSPYYVAPEVLRKSYTDRADIWSLGVNLYVLLSGLPPFWGDANGSGTERQIFQMILAGDVDLETAPWPSVSAAAKDLVLRLLRMDPAARPTCSEILQHPWLQQEGHGSDRPLDNVVLTRMRKFAGVNKLKKTALMVIGTCLTPEEIAGMKRLFKTIDHDRNGKITVSELKHAIKLWGHRIPAAEVETIMAAADVDGDGEIDYNEFVAATMNISQLEKEDLIWRAFTEFDTDGSGWISFEELEKALRKFGIKDDVRELMVAADADGDGQIDFPEFIQLMRETSSELAACDADAGLLRSTLPIARPPAARAATAAHG